MTTRKARVLEKALQARTVTLARNSGWKVWHISDSRRFIPGKGWIGDKECIGFPDLVMARPGQLLIVELKSDGGAADLSAEQFEAIDALRQAGVDVRIWTPADEMNGEIAFTICGQRMLVPQLPEYLDG